jgi:hypothetical protein
MNNEITIKLENNKIVVSGAGHTYSFSADEPARNAFGRETGNTWREEFEAGNLAVEQVDCLDPSMVGTVWAGE